MAAVSTRFFPLPPPLILSLLPLAPSPCMPRGTLQRMTNKPEDAQPGLLFLREILSSLAVGDVRLTECDYVEAEKNLGVMIETKAHLMGSLHDIAIIDIAMKPDHYVLLLKAVIDVLDTPNGGHHINGKALVAVLNRSETSCFFPSAATALTASAQVPAGSANASSFVSGGAKKAGQPSPGGAFKSVVELRAAWLEPASAFTSFSQVTDLCKQIEHRLFNFTQVQLKTDWDRVLDTGFATSQQLPMTGSRIGT